MTHPDFIERRGEHFVARLTLLGTKSAEWYEMTVLNGELMQGIIAESLNPLFDRLLDKLERRLDAIEARVAHLEARQ